MYCNLHEYVYHAIDYTNYSAEYTNLYRLEVGAQATARRVEWRDDSEHTLSPPAIRGLAPRLARRIRTAELALRMDKGALEGQLTSLELRGVAAEGYPGETANFVKPCAPSPHVSSHSRCRKKPLTQLRAFLCITCQCLTSYGLC